MTSIPYKFHKVSDINTVPSSEKTAGSIFFDDATRSIYVYNSEGISVKYDGSTRWDVYNSSTSNQYNIVTNANIGDIFMLSSTELQLVVNKKIINNTTIQFTTLNSEGYSIWKGDLINYYISKIRDVSYQEELISGETIKTINNYSILGEGNIDIDIPNKGYFKTISDLIATHPISSAGSIAYVGTGYPYKIYMYSTTNKDWEDTSTYGGDPEVDISKFLTATTFTDDLDFEEITGDYLSTSGGLITGSLRITDNITSNKDVVAGGDVYATNNLVSYGNASISKTVTAESFKVLNGTNEHVLLADGTIKNIKDLTISISLVSVNDSEDYEDIII